MRLTRLQNNFILKRIHEIVQEKEIELREKYTTPEKVLTDKKRFELLRDRKVPMLADVTEVDSTEYLHRVYDFSAFEHDEIVDETAFAEAMKPVRKDADVLRNAAILGDGDAALKLLKDFEGKYA